MSWTQFDSPTRHKPPLLFVAAAVVLFSLLTADAAPARVAIQRAAPSRGQLARLNEFESLIRYFTSIGYGRRAAHVPPNYVRALVLGESSAHKHATSHKGARGLTQIMPETAREAVAELLQMNTDFLYVDRARLENFSPADLYDPAVNILIAAYLTANYHADYAGSSALVTAAWNAGPTAVQRYGNQTPPYAETHQLIDRVSGYMHFFDHGHTASTFGGRWSTGGWDAPGWNHDFDSPF